MMPASGVVAAVQFVTVDFWQNCQLDVRRRNERTEYDMANTPTAEFDLDLAEIDEDEIPSHIYDRRWTILGVLCMSLMIVVIGNTSLNVALPAMSESLGLTNSQQQWVVDAYSLVFAGMLFTAGSL